jgi:hypothetical protein
MVTVNVTAATLDAYQRQSEEPQRGRWQAILNG